MSVVVAITVWITYSVPGHYREATQCPGKVEAPSFLLVGQSDRSGSSVGLCLAQRQLSTLSVGPEHFLSSLGVGKFHGSVLRNLILR